MLRNPGLRKSVEQPVLDLNFAASQIGSNGAPDSRIDFSRGSNAWFVDSDGLVKKSPHNLVLNSQSIANGVSGWSVSSATESSLEAPDGLDGSTKITFAGIDQVYVLVSVEAGQEYRFSYYVKLGTKPNNRYAIYDHTNGSFIVSSSVVSGVSSDEWTRVSFELTAPSGCTQIRFYVDRADTVNTENGTTFITGVQVSQHTTLPVDNPYIKTEGSAVYAARLDHDPAWFMSAAQEQNLLEYSEMLDDSGWTKNSVTVTANAETDPLGGTTAEYIFATSPSGDFPSIQGSFDTKKGAVHTVSFYAKAGEIDVVSVGIRTSSGGYVSDPFSNQALTSEWQRFSGTFTATEDTHLVRFFFGSGAKTWSGDQGFYIWGTQIEVGSTASTYHRTEGAPYYGPGATLKGLLIEEARTNLATDSEDFVVNNELTRTENDLLAPDGTTTADKFVINATSNQHVAEGNGAWSGNITTGTAHTTSFFVKLLSGTPNLALRGFGLGGFNEFPIFDLDAGTVVRVGTSYTSASIEDYGNGWLRCVATCTPTSQIEPLLHFLESGNESGTLIYTGNGTDAMAFWGLQVEAGSFPTSYIQTTGSTATRNADVATMGPTTGGTELVTNGTFDTDTTGWSETHSMSSVSSGQLVIDHQESGNAFFYQNISVVSGRRYRLTHNVVSKTGSVFHRIGDGSDYEDESVFANTGVSTGDNEIDFTAPSTNLINFTLGFTSGSGGTFDNVSVRELYPFEQYNPAEGTVVCDFERVGDGAFERVWEISDGTTQETISVQSLNDLKVYFFHKEGNVNQLTFKTADCIIGQNNITAFAYKENSFHISSVTDGAFEDTFTDTLINVPAVNTLGIASSPAGGNQGNMFIKRLTYYPYRLNDAVCDSKVSS